MPRTEKYVIAICYHNPHLCQGLHWSIVPSSERLPGEYFVKNKFQQNGRDIFYHLIVGSCLHALRNSSIVTSPSLLPHSFWDSKYGNQGWPYSCSRGRWPSCHLLVHNRWPTCQLSEKFRSEGLHFLREYYLTLILPSTTLLLSHHSHTGVQTHISTDLPLRTPLMRPRFHLQVFRVIHAWAPKFTWPCHT